MEKILFLGAGSEKDPGFEDVKIGGIQYRSYMAEKGIKVVNPMVIESCHGCPDLMKYYSEQMQIMADDGHRVVAVLQGGLYFALPSIQATQVTYPIISCPLDAVSQQAFILPPGHAAIASAYFEKHEVKDGKKVYDTRERQKALMAAERILNLEGGDSVAVVDETDKLEKRLKEFGIRTDQESRLLLSYGEGPFLPDERFPNAVFEIFYRDTNKFPEPKDMWLWGPEEEVPFLEVWGDQNLAVFAAKILSLQRPELRGKIKEIASKKRGTYTERDLFQELGIK